MEIFQLRYFLAVAEHLSFTRAAQHLNISQPPPSLQIKKLEQELGGELFVRDTHSVRLSDLGDAFVPRARQILEEVASAVEEIGAIARLERGTLRVGASGALAYYLLPKLLIEYRARYPAIDVEIVERRTSQLLRLAENNEIDVALIRLPHARTTLVTRHLASERLVAAVPASHRLAGASAVALGELREDPLILIAPPDEPFHDLIVELCASAGFKPRIALSGSNHATSCRLAGLGMGVCILTEMSRHLRVDPMPVFLPIEDEMAISSMALVSQPDERLGTAARAFIAMIMALDIEMLRAD